MRDYLVGHYNVGKEEIPNIAKAATRTESGELYDQVSALIRAKL